MTQSKQIAALLRKPVTGHALHHVAGGAKPSSVPQPAVPSNGGQHKSSAQGDGRGSSY